ncbi:protein neprosin-like [Elaeis guineensis]|uniref:protein neprosin-like n=1 Tax=Elaeis guineensis var. tenera TaxID=51953 RepID=UPI003C6CEC47
MATHASMSHSLIVLLLVIIYFSYAKAGLQPMRQQLEVQRYLKKLNKPAIKSIKSPDGDIIDCVHISHQPAFDHPSLRNHAIQTRPSFHPLGLYDESKLASKMETKSIPQLWHQNGMCPEDTIPIRRTKKEDVLRATSVERYGKKRHRPIPNPTSVHPTWSNTGHEHAVVYARGGKYYGAKAQINVWNPMVQERKEFSLSQLWVSAGPVEQLNTVEAGWHVCPSLYGDDKTRLFAYWTSDSYRSTGCYNLGCSGFIQVNRDIALGAVIYPISSYGGREYEITLLIWKDPISGNWWLQYGNLSPIGYWPSSLFRDLSDSASLIEWGGEVVNLKLNGGHTSTKMGSGHFPGEGFGKASYFKNIQIVDQSNHLQAFQGIDNIITRPTCYDLRHADEGYIYYGGPGRNPNCP